MSLQPHPLPLSPLVAALFTEAAAVLKPPPSFTASQWAERNRYLSSESSAEVGLYRCSRAPYQRAMMDAIHIPGVEQIVFWTAAQLGKSLCMENVFGYFAAEDACPVIWMWPTDLVAKQWSADTLDPMLRDTPALSRLVAEGSRKRLNAALFKKFPGGWLAVIGANAPAGLRRRRARVILADEVDGYPASAGREGDPVELAAARSVTFWNAVQILASTCTEKGGSRIEGAYGETNRQKYWVPCPHCQEFQLLNWKRVSWPKGEDPTVENTSYACAGCAVALTEFDKAWMLEHGEWRAERLGIVNKQGFWISGIYSPFVTWAKAAASFMNAMQHRENVQLLKTFVNLYLAETWEDRDEQLDPELRNRREDYSSKFVPAGVVLLTAGVDVQQDRIEVETVGWGRGEESWSVDFVRMEGDTALPDVWQKLDEYLLQRFWHQLAPNDLYLNIAAAFVDAGFRAAHVYAFTKTRSDRRIFASRGISGFGKAPVGKWNRNNQARVKMYPVAVDVVKEMVYSRLRINTAGGGFMHFSREKNDAAYFDQLTAEQIKRKYVNGFPVRYWLLPPGKRNEALDCRVYATAALYSLVDRTPVPMMLEKLHKALIEQASEFRQRRLARTDPNQLALLDVVDAAAPASPVQALAAGEQVAAAPAPVSDKSLKPTPPKLRIRRSPWL